MTDMSKSKLMRRDSAAQARDSAYRSLSAGLAPDDLGLAIQVQLVVGDRLLGRDDVRGAAKHFARACELAFHRVLHFDSTSTPFTAGQNRVVDAFRLSSAAVAVRSQRGRMGAVPGQVSHPLRATLLTRGNANFVGEVSDMLASDPRVEMQHVDLLEAPGLSKGLFNTQYVGEQILTKGASPTGQESIISRAERALRPIFDTSDVVFVDWCGAAAVLVNLVDPRATRVVVRLHSYEAFTHWPHLMDWSRVDDLVFVSQHLRDFAVDAVPGLTEANAPRLHVLPLNRDLKPFVRPKPTGETRFELGLVSWGNVAKDPLWALEVVRALRRHDERYRLQLIGSEFNGEVSAAAARYGQQLTHELCELENQGAVITVGQTDDVPAVLSDIGVILSSSVRESFHAAVVEGTASGAVPVVRDWPFFAHRPTGARSLYPADWIVSTPDEAADRILRLTQDEATWRAAGEDARRLTMSTWDWEVVKPQYERFFLGE